MISLKDKLKVYGVSGDEVQAWCPFHEEEFPSFFLNKKTGLWCCFGCGRGGSFTSLLQLLYGISYLAARIEAHKCNFEKNEWERKEEMIIDIKDVPAFDATNKYLKSRGIDDKTAKEFDLRVNFFSRAVIIPVYQGGKLSGWAERRLDREPRYKYQPKGFSRNNTLFNLDRVKDSSWVVVVEGVFDCIAMWQVDLPTVAILGSNLGDGQVEKLKKFDTIIFIPDTDEAGKKLGEEASRKLVGKKISIVDNIPGKDVGELTYSQRISLARIIRRCAK